MPNTFENVASKGGIKLTDSTITADVVRNMSTLSGDLGGIALNNSPLNVASFIENSGTIRLTDGTTIRNSTVHGSNNSGGMAVAQGASVTFSGANSFRSNVDENGLTIGIRGSAAVEGIPASGDDPTAPEHVPAQRGELTARTVTLSSLTHGSLTVGSDTDASSLDVIDLNVYSSLTLIGIANDRSSVLATNVTNDGTISLSKSELETETFNNHSGAIISITNSEFEAVSVVNRSGKRDHDEYLVGFTVGNSMFTVTDSEHNGVLENTGNIDVINSTFTADIYGDISMDISGGTFDNDCWIYGGCISTSRNVSSIASTIYGNSP